MTFRIAGSADVPALLAMMAHFNAHEAIPFDAATFRPRLERLVSDPQLGAALLLEEHGTPVAYAIVTFGYDLEYGGRDAFLTELWVVESARGRGLGRHALAAAEAFARQQGALAIHLMVRFDNERAQRLYAANGFETEQRHVMTKRFSPR